MTDYLDIELMAIENAQFDGGSGEAMHKDLHRVATVSTGSKFCYQSCSTRLTHNLSEYDLDCNLGMASKWHRALETHRTVLGRHKRGARMQERKCSKSEFWQTLYRYGVHSMKDRKALHPFLSDTKPNKCSLHGVPG